MKGLFIPEITADMFRNGCLEVIESLMAGGEIYDIEYEPKQHWIPVSERLPEKGEKVLASTKNTVFTQVFKGTQGTCDSWWWNNNTIKTIYAWMPLQDPYQEKKL